MVMVMMGNGDDVSVDGDIGRKREGGDGGGRNGENGSGGSDGGGADDSGCDVSYNRGSRHVGGSCGGGVVAALAFMVRWQCWQWGC